MVVVSRIVVGKFMEDSIFVESMILIKKIPGDKILTYQFIILVRDHHPVSFLLLRVNYL